MLTEHRKKQISTFTGGIFAAGVAVAGVDIFRPLLTLLKDQQLTMNLTNSEPPEQVTESVHVTDTNLTALVDASAMPTWSVIVYGLGVVLSIAGFLALIIGYAAFIASAGTNTIASNRWPLTIAISGLASLVCGLSGGWLTGWMQNQAADGQGMTYYGYAINDQSTFFVTVIASAVLTLLGLMVSHTHELEEETSGLI
ncbi:hypothetical protein AAFP32_13830 [Brevibacterium sp. CBA3109]|uniref:DUF2975 domain-containing protein n=1 Tax=Brevibacterium koreense TaxID=3140787 RepID=A0AAU7UJM9_9MICO